MQRTKQEPSIMPGAFYIGDWRADPSLHSITGAAGEVRLEPKVMQVLVELAEHPGQVVSKDRLLQTVWADTFVGDEVLARAISELRRALGDDPKASRYIQTIPKGGYRLIAQVTFGSAPAAGMPPEPLPSSSVMQATRQGLRRLAVAVSCAAAVAAWLVARHVRSPRSPSPTERPPITLPFSALPGSEGSPSFSPEGTRLAFQWDPQQDAEFRIFVKLIGDDPPQQLTHGPGRDMWPSWSRDGRSIAFTRIAGENSGIIVIPALGGPERRVLAAHWENERRSCQCQTKWSPDGRRLIFMARPDKGPCQMIELSLDTLESRVLAKPPSRPAFDMFPTYSPDGQTIAFAHYRGILLGDVYIMPARGGGPTRLTFDDAWILGLAWMPDGESIVYASTRAGPSAPWRISVRGGSPEALGAGESAASPAIDSIGRRLAFVHYDHDTEIYALDLLRPSAPLNALAPSSLLEHGPQFSPDGRRLAFQSRRAGRDSDIWVADSDGSNAMRLSFFDHGQSGTPRWSPDSQWITFDSSVDGDFGVYMIRAVGGAPKKLTENGWVPSWSQDGKWIYFASNRSGLDQIWKMPAAGGSVVRSPRTADLADSNRMTESTFTTASTGCWAVSGAYRLMAGRRKRSLPTCPRANIHGSGR